MLLLVSCTIIGRRCHATVWRPFNWLGGAWIHGISWILNVLLFSACTQRIINSTSIALIETILSIIINSLILLLNSCPVGPWSYFVAINAVTILLNIWVSHRKIIKQTVACIIVYKWLCLRLDDVIKGRSLFQVAKQASLVAAVRYLLVPQLILGVTIIFLYSISYLVHQKHVLTHVLYNVVLLSMCALLKNFLSFYWSTLLILRFTSSMGVHVWWLTILIVHLLWTFAWDTKEIIRKLLYRIHWLYDLVTVVNWESLNVIVYDVGELGLLCLGLGLHSCQSIRKHTLYNWNLRGVIHPLILGSFKSCCTHTFSCAAMLRW